jgi:hypothetical protein
MVAALVTAMLAVGAVVAGNGVGAAAGPVVSLGDASGLERDTTTGSVFVPVFLSQAAAEPVVVTFFSTDGTAVAGVDFTRWGTPASPRSVTIPAGSLQTTINVPVAADSLIEGDETFGITVAAVTGGSATVGDGTGTATIIDVDELSTANPAITVSSGTVVEGDGGQRRAQFHVHLSRAASTTLTVAYTTADQDAVAGTDYTAKLPGTLVFPPGQISRTIDVLVASDLAVGPARSFRLEAVVLGGPPVEELSTTGTATIVDDDTASPTTTTSSSTTTSSTTTTTTTPVAAPVISTFALAGTPGSVPALVPLRWSVSDPAGGTLTCRIDGADDGVFEIVVPNCPSTGSRNVTTTVAGTTTARLRVESSSGASTEATRWIIATADPVESYDVALVGVGALDPSAAAAFTAAEARLEQLVIRGVADQTGVPARPSCLPSTSPDLPSTIDDLVIDVAVRPIDGVGGIVGQAGPTCLRATSNLPVAGQMVFDSADVANLVASGIFDRVVLHEMLHVLGYGTIWNLLGTATGTGGADPRYQGGRGVAEWSLLGGSANVPLENTGAAGTRDSHWRESTFGTELMTGYLNTGTDPLSRLSVASLADLGYQVDVTQADAYSLPGMLAALRLAPAAAPTVLDVQRPGAAPLG